MANALGVIWRRMSLRTTSLGMIFYYYLSDRTEDAWRIFWKTMASAMKTHGLDEEYKEAVVEEALRDLGFIIEPQFLFRKMVKMVENRSSFDIEFLQKAINALMESTLGNDSQEDFLTGCSLICSSTLLNWGIPSKTEVLSWQKSLPLWTKSTSE